MKTIPEWFKLLLCAARKKAMRNLIKTYGYVYKGLAKNINMALGMAFTWSETKDGFDYWSNIKISENVKVN